MLIHSYKSYTRFLDSFWTGLNLHGVLGLRDLLKGPHRGNLGFKLTTFLRSIVQCVTSELPLLMLIVLKGENLLPLKKDSTGFFFFYVCNITTVLSITDD